MATHGLNALAAAPRPDSGAAAQREALAKAAREFESLFMQMMLKSMRATEFGNDLMGDSGGVYRDMLDQTFAAEVGGAQGLGIADMMLRQLGGDHPLPPESPRGPSGALPRFDGTAAIGGAMSVRPADDAFADGPEAFVSQMLPHARRAAAELGLSPDILLAQAALESGWGNAPTGGHNLFGIKADAAWQGGSRAHVTREFRDGRMVTIEAAFRAYDDAGESFADYVEFLNRNPRYGAALDHGGDADVFLSRLQSAGYATDPAYADKVRRILHSDRFQQAMARAGDGAAAL